MNRHTRHLLLAGVVAAAFLAVSGCSQSPQDKYDDAVQSLQQAQQDRDQIQTKVNDKQQQLDKLKAKLKAANKQVDAAQDHVKKAAKAAGLNMTDAKLYRTLQRELLNKDTFGDSVISVRVHNHVVKLSGVVPDDKTRDAAVAQVKSHPAVKKVDNCLKIRGEESKHGKKKQAGHAHPKHDGNHKSVWIGQPEHHGDQANADNQNSTQKADNSPDQKLGGQSKDKANQNNSL